MYGLGNGVGSYDGFLERLSGYVALRSNKKLLQGSTEIGCIVLTNVVLLDEGEFFAPEDRQLSFPNEVVKFKYFHGSDSELLVPFTSASVTPFDLVMAKPRTKRTSLISIRVGQSRFREQVLTAYGRRCAISGEDTEEVLEAAHIQPYVNSDSNHLQNGIALRIDLHRLFDAGLITLTSDLRVQVSEIMKADMYKALHNKPVSLPKDQRLQPSAKATAFHREKVFRKAT